MRMRKRFKEFWPIRVDASDEFLRGNPDPLAAITAQYGQVLLFDPRGRVHIGFSAIVKANKKAATQFDAVRENRFDLLDIHYGRDFVSWTGIQRSEARRADTGEWVRYAQRMVEHYRPEDDGIKWSLRYATPLIRETI